MAIIHIISLVVAGVGSGFAGGLLGLGGAFIMTPVQYIVFTDMGIPPDMAIKLAFGTSLMVVLPTAISGAWRHHRRGAVYWPTAVTMGCCSLLAAFAGATLATHLPGAALKIAFGGVVLASGIRMLVSGPLPVEEKFRNNPWLWVAWAIPIGLVTGLLGIGGGILAVPILVLALKFRIHSAVATSLAMMILSSAGGVIGYIINGLGVANLPDYSIGYIYLPAWVMLAVTSIGMAQVGAITTHRLPAKQLRYIFVVVMFYMGLKMLGVFDWLGWPL
ncbi:sulfite exporter TauE/SafE family protein [Chloroflexota bacterium]